MPPLASDLRKQLENVCIAARDAAEAAACSALKKRAVDQAKPFAHFEEEDKRLRRWLRARGKQAGDVEGPDKSQSIEHLTQELAYEYWHRMLFARFLAENHLLMHPDGVAVSLEECEELAPSQRAPNGYVLAARYASRMLPQIFRIDDVLLDIEFAPEQRLALERLLASLPRETFLADDSLGWVYQFWQTKRKDEVNKSGDKIDGRTLPAVTQLFTEHYMVQFLLHNTIGAWWCARHGIAGPPGGAGVPAGKSPVPLDYLRWAPGPAVAPVAQPPPAGATGEGAQPGAAVPQSKEPTGSRGGDVAQPPSAGATLAKPVRAEYRRNLPHLQAEGKTYYVTFCTHQRWTLPEEVRPTVVKHCLHDEGLKLRMHALVVMPDHVHLIFTPMTDPLGKPYGLSEILGGIKGASAHTINKHLKRRGPVWQDESFDHILRREEKLEEKVEYVRQNPVRKGLVKAPEEYPYTWVEWRDLPAEGAQPRAAVPHARIEEAGEEPWAAVVASSLVAQPPPAVALADPAAGTFDGWPNSLKEFTMLDPCCGSGHFLVAGFRLLVPLRMRDEGLSARDACDAVLRENLFGLEIDSRCTQIAAFALALTAWTYPGPDGQPLGYRPLPNLNIACSGQGVVGSKEDWAKFAGTDGRFREGMERLYDLFQSAPHLGSLINPHTVTEDLFALGFDTLKGTVERALKKIEARDDPDRAALGVAAQGIALAASLMSRGFTLVATNVPYLARGKQVEELRDYIAGVHSAAKADLATAFIDRTRRYCGKGGTLAVVSPQNWWFLGSYATFRKEFLSTFSWCLAAVLGEEAWLTFGKRGPKTVLQVSSNLVPSANHAFGAIDASSPQTPDEKAECLQRGELLVLSQSAQLSNPDARVTLAEEKERRLLADYAQGVHGLGSKDSPCFFRQFWELPALTPEWEYLQTTVDTTRLIGGMQQTVFWQKGSGLLSERGSRGEAILAGGMAWGKKGVLISQMRHLPACLYYGNIFDKNTAVILPFDEANLLPIWAYCVSKEYRLAVRRIDQKVNVTNVTLVKVPFDLDHWKQIAEEQYPDGLPEPLCDDPTQWLFSGHPKHSTDPLQVAVARLLGYAWPDQEPDDLDTLADADGILPIPSVRGEPPAAERLREVLKTAFGPEWSASLEHRLLTEAGARSGTTLDDWLRNSFFEQHCKRFHQRPFIWHIWDGRKDGFSCLVNYHKLTHNLLDNLTHSYVQDWINLQAADARNGKPGADLRLAAAQALQEKLKLILAGEPPHDIFVRWKPLSEQPIGWNPDLNDGVRMNIRPFVEAGILRKPPNIKWTKDRGNEPQRPKEEYPWFWPGGTFKGDRVNDVHLTNQEKMDAMRDRS